jgi:hypothetical protein
MNIEKWINHNEDLAAEFSNGDYVISSYKLRELLSGKVLVPVEPTDAMVDALYPGTGAHTCRGLYQAMLAASQEQGK